MNRTAEDLAAIRGELSPADFRPRAGAYLPDGTPADGPVTTAQTLAFELAEWGPTAGHLGGMWRAAAAREGERWSAALRRRDAGALEPRP